MMALLDDVERSNDADVSELLRRLATLIAADDAPPLPQIEPAASLAGPTAATAPAGECSTKTAERTASIRVPVPLVDRLMTLAGELVLARNQALRSIDDGAGGHAARPASGWMP